MVPALSTAGERSADPRYLDRDGRRLACATYGDPDGLPVVFCHGTPGSRRLGQLLDAPATKRGVRLLTPDRPGIGKSEPAQRGIDDWPDDVAALLDHVHAESARVLGFSAGAPFALACHRLDAVEGVTLVSGAGPPGVGDEGTTQQVFGRLARATPRLLAPVFRLQRAVLARRGPEAALDLVADEPPRTETLGPDEIARLVKRDALAATSGGTRPVVRELGLVGGAWPFDLDDVSVPVAVFQGSRDTNVAPETGAELVERLPDATLARVDADHLGTLCAVAGRALSGPTPV